MALSSSKAGEVPGLLYTYGSFDGAKRHAKRALKAGRKAVVFLDCPDKRTVLLDCDPIDGDCLTNFDIVGREECEDCVDMKRGRRFPEFGEAGLESLPLGVKLAAVGAVAWAYLAWKQKKLQAEIDATGAAPPVAAKAG